MSTHNAPGYTVLHVANTGPAVPPAEIDRLLRPFQRLGADRTNRDGHGLGLSIVAAIAVAHGGTLDLQARAEGGLRVSVALPLAPAGRLAGAGVPG